MSKVFVSPGVYTREIDLSYVTRQIGVTTLGLVGETTKGPAFEPVFLTDYRMYQKYFGFQNPEKFKGTGMPKYELPYIAKSYLSETNQLYVTRVLGLSGYDAGSAWAIVLKGAPDLTTQTNVSTGDTTFSFTATTAGKVLVDVDMTSPSSGVIYDAFNHLINDFNITLLSAIQNSIISTGDTFDVPEQFYSDSTSTWKSLMLPSIQWVSETVVSGSTTYTGVLSGTSSYAEYDANKEVEGKVVAMLRSRGEYELNNNTEHLAFNIGTRPMDGHVEIVPNSPAIDDPLGYFTLSGESHIGTHFTPFKYDVSLDATKRNYIVNVLGLTNDDKNAPVFVEEIYQQMFEDLVKSGNVGGIITTLIPYENEFGGYKQQFQSALSPWVLSEVNGNKIFKLFKFVTISDGNGANRDIKISIVNIKPNEKEFDVLVRDYYDTDKRPQIIERYSRCTLNPKSTRYIARMIGTTDGEYQLKSNNIMVKLNDEIDISDKFPAGFIGFPLRDFTGVATIGPVIKQPQIIYKTQYQPTENKRKFYLGLSDTVGIEDEIFDYKGLDENGQAWTASTNGFHMDIALAGSGITVDGDSTPYTFVAGNALFRNEGDLQGTDYEKLYARKFTFTVAGGFDGWDVYRSHRTNTNNYRAHMPLAESGILRGIFSNRPQDNDEDGLTSDYYAYWEAIRTFANPESTNINIFATPGIDLIDNPSLIDDTIEMVENERADSAYFPTLPDNDITHVYSPEEVVDLIDGRFDSNYSAIYYPWVQIDDIENNVLIWLPPTRDVVRNVALTDNISFPWFAVAGLNRGDVKAVRARNELTLTQRDALYENRINPLITIPSEGLKIWGNKTLQVDETALNRLNVRRLLLQARKLISAVSLRLIFEQNDAVVRAQFLKLVNPILDNIRAQRGLYDFKIEVSDDPEDFDRNTLHGIIYIKPTKALEYVQVDFVVTNTGASFDAI